MILSLIIYLISIICNFACQVVFGCIWKITYTYFFNTNSLIFSTGIGSYIRKFQHEPCCKIFKNIMNAIKFYDALCFSNYYFSGKLYSSNKQIIIRSSLRRYCRHVASLFLTAYIFLKLTYKKWIKIEFQVLSLISGDGFNRENTVSLPFFIRVTA